MELSGVGPFSEREGRRCMCMNRPGGNNRFLSVPVDAALGYATARFRLSRDGGLQTTGSAPDGEVEDYAVLIKTNEGMDFGDAPDPTYPTVSGTGSAGAVHQIVVGYHLGASVDWDHDGQPDAGALGDDADENNDDDGVELLTPLVPGKRRRFG